MVKELVAAVGNPDVASTSPAMEAFEASLSSGDPARIRGAAAVVQAHLRAGCAAIAPYFDLPDAGAWAVDVRGLFDGYSFVVADERDAAIAHEPARVEAARSRVQTIVLDHFWQAVKADPEGWRSHLRNGWSATASHLRWILGEVGAAFDGSEKTAWIAGDVPAPQWLEVDFGAELTVASVRLLTYQDAAGESDHRLVGRTGSGRVVELTAFTGTTHDRQWLEYRPSTPVGGLRWVRVTTLVSPTIGWREMEVVLAPGSVAAGCPASSTVVTPVRATGNRLAPGDDAAAAIDGKDSTGVRAAPGGPAGNAGSVRVYLGSMVRISSVRILLGPGSPTATFDVSLFAKGSEMGDRLGTIESPPEAGGWVTLPGPIPCLPYESVYLFARSPDPVAKILEIKILGTPAD